MQTNLYSLVEQRLGHPWFGRPFYIGVGTARRPRTHIENACKNRKMNSMLGHVIRSHFRLGLAPEVRVLAVLPDKAWADYYERGLIKAYGRRGIDKGGVLCNTASGGQGPDAALMQLPYFRKKNSEAQKKSYRENPERRLAASAGGRQAAKNPENKKKKVRASVEMNARTWADPVIREKRITGMRGKKKTMTEAAVQARQKNGLGARSVESRAKNSESLKRVWTDPKFHAVMSAKRRSAWSDPVKRAAMLAGRSEGIARSWRNPETRAKRIAAIKATMASARKT